MSFAHITILATLSAAVAFSPAISLAQGGLGSATKNLKTVVDKAEIKEGDIGNVVGKGINIALTLVGLIFLILTVYAGFLWMTARGDEGQVEKAQEIITASVIGLIIVVSAYAITTFVTKRFDTGPSSQEDFESGTGGPCVSNAECKADLVCNLTTKKCVFGTF